MAATCALCFQATELVIHSGFGTPRVKFPLVLKFRSLNSQIKPLQPRIME